MDCKFHKTTIENFVSMNFKSLSTEEVTFIREKFIEKDFQEGLFYKVPTLKKATLLSKILGKKNEKRIPVTTIRDFLCHLNYTKGDKMYA